MSRRNRNIRLRLLAAFIVVPLIAAGIMAGAVGSAAAATVRAFAPVFSTNTTGDILLRGNTLMTCQTAATGGGISCPTAQGGSTGANNNFNMIYVDVDSDPTTFNSSSSTVTIPAGGAVLFAALSWSAETTAGTSGAAPRTVANNGTVLFQVPGATTYSSVNSTQTDVSGVAYQGYADVTSLVQASGSGSYSVANVQAGTGVDRYAGWSLIVAYRDPTQPTRNLGVYTGFGIVALGGADSTLDVPINGFITPPTGAVVTRLGVVAYEGDRGNVGDGLTLGSTPISNDLNPVNDIFNSTVSDLNNAVTARSPSYTNLLGYDVDRFDATGVLGNGATSTVVHFITKVSNGETYFPGALTFATNLYAPTLTSTKTVTDENAGTVSLGDVLDYSIGVSNTGGDASVASILHDVIPTGTTYVPGSLTVGGVATTDATGDDAGDVGSGVINARLGTGATASVGGRLAVGATSSVAFKVTVNSGLTDGTTISNAASLTYNGETSGTALTGSSNTVSSTVVVPPTLTFTAPPAATVASGYSNQLTESGGTAPYTWSISAGTLPAGITLSATGLLSGTPTAAGTSNFTVRLADSNGRFDTRAVTFVVNQLSSTVGLTRSAASVTFGTAVTFTAAVGPSGAGGSVIFTDTPPGGAAVVLGSGTVSGGAAAVTAQLPQFGAHSIVATYSGDGNHAGAASSPVAVEVSAYAGELIVDEFRSSGPSGANDSYVELYNTGPSIPLAGFVLSTTSGTTVTLPANSGALGMGRSYLLTGADYSLGATASSDDSVATLGTGGIALIAPDTAATHTDAVGPGTGFHLGTGLPAFSGTPTAQYAWVRTRLAGAPVDTHDNSADFQLVSTTTAAVGGITSMLGSASPTGTGDPYQHNGTMQSVLLDAGVGSATAPNRVVLAGTPRTLIVRRIITNSTGATVTAAKVRLTALSELNGAPQPGVASPPARKALLRAINPAAASSSVALSGGGTLTVQNLSVDPPSSAQPGGGLNSTLTVPLPPGGLAPGASVNVAFTFAADSGGTFWFGYDVDAVTGSTP